jgi:phosphoribosylformimino-5-aminoimidazole carboxamide ribotide isomerase
MEIIPAIDLKGGKCVRLLQGEMDKETVFSDSPADMARRWQALGAGRLHIVDLDGAVAGRPRNLDSIEAIRGVASIPLQVGGGFRSLQMISEVLGLGVDRVVLGTVAYRDPALLKAACARFPDRIVAGIDARDGKVAIEGWKETTQQNATELARSMEAMGIAAIIFTDIRRDGMMEGPNLAAIRELARSVDLPVIASGGVSTSADIEGLVSLEEEGVTGIIVGRALYEGRIDLREAVRIARDRSTVEKRGRRGPET